MNPTDPILASPGPSVNPGGQAVGTVLPSKTRIGVSFRIAPLADIRGNLATLLGESMLRFVGMFYPMTVARKANVVATELVQNVLENIVDPASEMQLQLSIDGDVLVIEVRNKASVGQFEAVQARIDALARSDDPKRLFGDTLRARRSDRLRGGLGLLRLVAESRFRLAVDYDEHELLTVRAAFLLGGTR